MFEFPSHHPLFHSMLTPIIARFHILLSVLFQNLASHRVPKAMAPNGAAGQVSGLKSFLLGYKVSFLDRTQESVAYNTKIIKTHTTKEVYFYEKSI